MDKPSDLLSSLRSGDCVDWKNVFVEYGDLVYNYLWVMSGDVSQAAEQTKATFVRAFCDANAPRGPIGFRAWLIRTAYETFLKAEQPGWWIQQNSPSRPAPRGAEAEDRLPNSGAGPARERQGTVLQSAILQAFQDLTPRQRCAVVLHDREHWSKEDVAEVLRCSTKQVTALLHQSRPVLNSRLSAFVVEPGAATPGR